MFAWHALQLPAVVTDAPTSLCPALHGVVAVHAVLLCDVDVWKVNVPQPEQVRAAVLESADVSCPAPHSVWAAQLAMRWSDARWNVFAPQLLHTKSAVCVAALLTNVPLLHVEITVHTLFEVTVCATDS